jgi:hypothetical protein
MPSTAELRGSGGGGAWQLANGLGIARLQDRVQVQLRGSPDSDSLVETCRVDCGAGLSCWLASYTLRVHYFPEHGNESQSQCLASEGAPLREACCTRRAGHDDPAAELCVLAGLAVTWDASSRLLPLAFLSEACGHR